MALKLKSIITASVTILMCVLIGDKRHGRCDCIKRRIMVLGPENESKLWTGDWIVLTSVTRLENIDLEGIEHHSIALLSVNSLENARIAAKLGMDDAEGAVFIAETSQGREGLKRTVAFQEALDYMVYHQIMLLKHSIESDKLLKLSAEKIISFLIADIVSFL